MKEEEYFPNPSGITAKDWEELYNNGIPICAEDLALHLKHKLILHFKIDEEVKDLERQLEEEKAKTKALLVGLEVQHFNDFINRANVENYKELGENITIGFKTQLKEQG